jgi:hypothetical protein
VSEAVLGEHITTFQRPRLRKNQTMFRIMLALTGVCLLFLLADGSAKALAAIGLIPAIFAVAYGITMLKDKAQTVELYSHGLVIRDGVDGMQRDQVLWKDVSDFYAQNTDKATTAAVVGGVMGGMLGAALLTSMSNPSGGTPTVVSFMFKDKKRKLSLDRSYQPLFGPIQYAAVDYWLAETNDQLRQGKPAALGTWQVSVDGISTGKETIPWSTITQVVAEHTAVMLAYRDVAKNKERRVRQRLYLRSSVLGLLTTQMQTTGIPPAVGLVG